MCGIAGIVSFDPDVRVDPAVLERMAGALAHRGPDDQAIYLNPSGYAGLAFRRLSVIDLEGGRQPMSSEDQSVWLVFNGEIYNFTDLRKGLETRRHVFRTRSDSETIVHLYEENGTTALQALHGMFAFAIWDETAQTLFLARDRLGKKPLYYRHWGKQLAFASEIKALLEVPGTPREVEEEALEAYLAFQYVPAPLTLFKGIHALPPAHHLLFDPRGLKIQRWWKPEPIPPDDRTLLERPDDLAQEVFSVLFSAVKRRLVADVPIGVFLSGGLDSSIVTGLASLAQAQPVRTFSIGFEESEWDELPHARRVAEHFKTEHREFVVRPDAVALLPTLVWHHDQPYADSSAIPTYYLAQMTRKHVTVALTGDAGDECFLGYSRYLAGAWAGRMDVLPAFVRRMFGGVARAALWPFLSRESRSRKRYRFLSTLDRAPWARYLEWISVFDEPQRRRLMRRPAPQDPEQFAAVLHAAFAQSPVLDPAGRTGYADLLTYLPGDLLTKVDVATMAHGLEARSPFLDPEVVGLALAIPSRLKIGRGEGKRILRTAFAGLLPPETLARGKQGFGVPLARWFRHELREMVGDLLLDARARGRGYFDPSEVERLVREHQEGSADHSHRLWALLVFETWLRIFIEQSLTVGRPAR